MFVRQTEIFCRTELKSAGQNGNLQDRKNSALVYHNTLFIKCKLECLKYINYRPLYLRSHEINTTFLKVTKHVLSKFDFCEGLQDICQTD